MARILIDTNVLLILIQPAHRQYSLASSAVTALLGQEADLCVAPQNFIEFWVVSTRPQSPPMDWESHRMKLSLSFNSYGKCSTC